MKATVMIDGREALPVRAIPLVSGWSMPPDRVAMMLAHEDSARRFRAVSAKHISGGAYHEMLPKEWNRFVDALSALSDRLPKDNDGYCKWQNDSITLLPPNTFVWLDEFEPAFEQATTKENWVDIDSRTGEEVDRPGDRDLNLYPLLDGELRRKIVEGFEAVATVGEQQKVPDLSIRTAPTASNWLPKCMILAVEWPMPNSAPKLESIMEKIPAYVNSACNKAGRPGGGPDGSHLWNPAQLAVCLAVTTPHKYWRCEKKALTNLIRNSFSDFLDEWTAKMEEI